MTEIQETLADYELAVLAKSKGFDANCVYAWCEKGGWNEYTGKQEEITHILRTNGNPFGEYFTGKNWNVKIEGSNKNRIICSAPTSSLLQTWLREKHNIKIFLKPLDRDSNLYTGYVYANKYFIAVYSENPTKKYEDILRTCLINSLNLLENVYTKTT